MTAEPAPEVEVDFRLRGGNQQLFMSTEPEVLLEGPAGTGKTRTILEYLHLACKNRKIKVLLLRKTRESMTDSVLATLENKVFHELEFARGAKGMPVEFFGGNDHEPAAYRYSNGSVMVIGGMDNPSKVLSTEYDKIYVCQAEEITESEWSTLSTRLRNFAHPYMQLIGDCNPSYSKHWLNRRCLARYGPEGEVLPPLTRRIITTHHDNPLLYDDNDELTDYGKVYIETRLGNLQGPERERFLLGNWIGVENAIYPHFDRHLHVRPLEPGLVFRTGAIGVDYGRRHKAASVVISVDQYGRRWVREAWGEPDEQQGAQTRRAVAAQRAKYSIYRGRADPTQDSLAGILGFNTAKAAAGSRNGRIMAVARLLNIFPGGEVPESQNELLETSIRHAATYAPHELPDSPGLLFVQGAPGIDDLCDEIESYHEVLQENDTRSEYTVARIDDDLVAALEYGIEELEAPAINHIAMGSMLKKLRGSRR